LQHHISSFFSEIFPSVQAAMIEIMYNRNALQIHTACTTVTSNIAVLCSKILLMPHTFSPSTLLVLTESNLTGILCQYALQ
jgi:hypothetical protein